MTVEPELVESARSGGAALERLIAEIWPEAYRIALSILRDPGLAEDAAQEACASLARSLPSLKNAGAFHTWTYRIVANHAVSTARRNPRTQPLETLDERGIRFDDSDALDLHRALAALTPVQRATTLLHYYAGLNSGEIAAAVGLPSSTVRFHLMLARRALRQALTTEESQTPQPREEIISHVR